MVDLNKIIDRLLKEDFDDNQINKIFGPYEAAYFAYAQDETIRKNAASGGTVTAILWNLLLRKEIDGALVCRSVILDGMVKPEFVIATSLQDLRESQGSKYISTRFIQEAIPLIERFNGDLAVVTLPCDAKVLKSYLDHHSAAHRKVKVVISLFCGHLSTKRLTKHVIDQMRPTKEAELVDFRYRSGHWRGKLTAKFNENSIVERPFSIFSDYQNLNFFSERKCLHCFDHTGYYSDISLGDIWLQEMKAEPIKHSAVIAKTKTGLVIVEKTSQDRDLTVIKKPISLIAEGQSRSLKIHYNISARAKAGRFLGVQIKDHVNEKVRWVDFIIAYILIFNHKFTQLSWGRKLVSWIPRPLIKAYLYFLKGLEIL